MRGDRVALWAPNRAEWTLTQYATAELGLILVNINPAYRQTELEFALNQGYWNDPEKTAETIDRDGWMHTGDLATMDDAGYVQITGRIKDMVIRGGENVYPREIEDFLNTHPDILDAQVIGVPDDRYGEELMAWIRLREGAPTFDETDLRAFAAGKIARHKIPK